MSEKSNQKNNNKSAERDGGNEDERMHKNSKNGLGKAGTKLEKIEIKKRNRPQTRAYWKDIERIGDREQKQRTNSTERIK